jgi:hypothetical protein
VNPGICRAGALGGDQLLPEAAPGMEVLIKLKREIAPNNFRLKN